jgi:hypothetical protein
MFRTEIAGDFSFVGWFVQLGAAIIVPSGVALFTAGRIVDLVESRMGPPVSFWGQCGKFLWYLFFVWGTGFFLALLIARVLPGAREMGRWVWPVPVLLFLIMFIVDASMSSLRYALSQFIYPGTDSGEAWWGVMLATFPTCQAVLYSLGMLVSRRAQRTYRMRELPK